MITLLSKACKSQLEMNKLMLGIVTVVLVAVTVPLSADAAKIRVLLTNVNHNVGYYAVVVSMNSKSVTKTVYTGTQTCPDDVMSLCYTNLGTFSFGNMKKGAIIGVCNHPTTSTDNFCDFFTYTGKRIQTVRSNVQDLTADQTPVFNPNSGLMEYP